jgi:hypothetical protein
MKIQTIGFFILMLFLLNCRGKNENQINVENIDTISLTSIEEKDTLTLKIMPDQMGKWLQYYQQFDTAFKISAFIASGVALHIDDLPDAIINGNEKEMADLFHYSSDSTKYVDLISYNFTREKDKLYPGEIDQQVILADKTRKLKKQLMFNGPADLAECADWIGPTALLIGVTHKNPSGDTINAEIFMFQLNDSTYTNFRLNHSIILNATQLANPSFMEYYFSLYNINVQ